MSGAAKQFMAELDAEWAAMMADLESDVVNLAQQAVDKLVDRSPVKTGLFKANWTVSIGALDEAVTLVVDPSGAAAKARASGALAAYSAANGFPEIMIQNNLDYADELENGRSGQAPNGMVALTVAELAAMWEAIRK